MNQVLAGALAMGFGVAGLFFLRFWRETRDRLFALFAAAFFIMAPWGADPRGPGAVPASAR